MKLWTLAEISAELAAAPKIISSPDSNLITLNNKTTLCHLPYIFPFTDQSGSPWNAVGTYEGLAAIALAAQHLNTGDGSIVPEVAGMQCGVKFNVAAFDTALSESIAVDQIIQITDRTTNNNDDAQAIAATGESDSVNLLLRPPCVIIGAARSADSMPTSIISGLRGFPQISPISTSPALDDKSQYKYFARTIPNDDGTSVPFIARLNSGTGGNTSGGKDESESWGVNYLAVIYVDDAYGTGFAQGIVLAAQEMAPGMQVRTYSISNNADNAQIQRVVKTMAESEFMYFSGILYPDSVVDMVMTAAADAGIAGTGKHTWLFSDSVGSGITGRNFTVGSPLERAYRGTGMLSARGGIPGMKAYDALVEGMQQLGKSDEDKEYLYSLLPKYNSMGQVTNHTDVTDLNSFLMTTGLVAPFLYDAVISAGLSVCNLLKNHNATAGSFALNGGDHYAAILNTTFEGSSGTILLDPETGTRTPKSALFSLVNFVDDPDASTSTVVQFKSQETDIFEFGAWRSLLPFVFNSGNNIVPSDVPDVDVNRNYIPTGLRALGLVLCGVIIILSVGFIVWTKLKEKLRVVKAAQPIFLYIIAIGTLLMGSSIIPLSLDQGVASVEGASIGCIAVPWLLTCGFSMTFSALFTKTHRILTIMRNAAAFKRVKVTALDVAKPMIALLLTNIIVLAVWTGIDPMRSETNILETNIFNQPTETENICYSVHRGIFLAVLGIINIGALIIAFVEAYLARNISVELSESAYIMKAISIILLVCCMGIPVVIIAKDNTAAFYFVAVGIIFVVCISILCLIFIPKVRASMKPAPLRRHSLGAAGISRTSGQSETDGSGIKILSSPKAIADLEEENRKLKEIMAGRRLSHLSNTESEVVIKRLSRVSNDAMSYDAVEMESEQRRVVSFGSIRNGEEVNYTEMNVVDEEGSDIETEERVDIVKGSDVRNGQEEKYSEMNVVDEEEGGVGAVEKEEEIVVTQVNVVNGGDVSNGVEDIHTKMNAVDDDGEDIEKEENVDNQVDAIERIEQSTPQDNDLPLSIHKEVFEASSFAEEVAGSK